MSPETFSAIATEARKAMTTAPLPGIWICFAFTIEYKRRCASEPFCPEKPACCIAPRARSAVGFRGLGLPLREEQRVLDVLSGETVSVRDEFHAARHRVYLMIGEPVPGADGK